MKKNKVVKACAIGGAIVWAFPAFTQSVSLSCQMPYNGDGGVDHGCAIDASELTTQGYQFPNELIANANHTQLANHAWRLFIAANLPSTATLQNGAGRAAPDPTKTFNDSDQAIPQTNPTVWESFYHRAEAFPFYSSSAPSNPANQIPTYYFYVKADGMPKSPLTVSGQNYVNLDENNQVSQNMLYYNTATDPNFPLLYMAKVNSVELGYVWDKPFATSSSSLSFPHPVVTGPEPQTVSTIEVKSAWRRLSDISNTSTHDSYHQATATYYVGDESSPTPMTDTFALVALHIIQKTNNYQTFIFSTFEHVNSVEKDAHGTIVAPNIHLSYDTLVYGAGSPTVTNAYGAYSSNTPGQSGQSNVKTVYNLPVAGAQPSDRIPVRQLQTISAEVNDVNNNVANLMPTGSVWKNYRLKGVQGVPTSYPVNNGTVALDYYLANIVVESSEPGLQLFNGTVQNPNSSNNQTFTNNRALPGTQESGPNVSPAPTNGGTVAPAQWTMGGCMGCHGNAQQAGQDMSFLGFGLGGAGFAPDPVAPNHYTSSQRQALYTSIQSRKARELNYDD